MAQNPLIKRYLDAGMAFTQMTQTRAEAIVKDLVKAGEVQAVRTEEVVSTLVERSRENTEKLLELVRKEVRDQIAGLGLATKDDVARLESKLGGTAEKATKKPTKKATKKAAKVTAKKAGSKKAGSKKAGSKKTAAKKVPARAKKAPATTSAPASTD